MTAAATRPPDGASRSAAARPGSGRSSSSGRLVVQAWLLSRGLIALVALLLAVFTQRRVVDQVSNWDVQHFTRLALGGYLAEPNGQLMAFFPGLPAILGTFARLGLPPWITGVLLAAVCSALAAAALARLGGPWAAIGWLFAPTAVFTTVPYTESLFCAAAFWAWERARADKWGAAAALVAVACTVRVSGLFLLGALVVMIVTTRKVGWSTRLRRMAWLLIPAAVLALFATYLWTLTGSWSAWYQAQSTGWVRELTWPWRSFLNTIPAILPGAYADHPWWAAVFRAEMVSMALGVVVTVYCLVRRRWAEASWVGVQVLAFSLSYWFFSVNRAILLWFPLWIMLAEWGSWRPRRPAARAVHRALVVSVGVLLVGSMLFWSWLFFTGHWAS